RTAGQSHGRVVAALSAPKILSADEPAMATGAFAAIRQQEQITNRRLDDCLPAIGKRARRIVVVSPVDYSGRW
ncbi:MAG TPA: hypothetical protein VMH85_12715, partial [Terriglobales bacterium]|nr:hypothetical protein [Terriglobales bacterium]